MSTALYNKIIGGIGINGKRVGGLARGNQLLFKEEWITSTGTSITVDCKKDYGKIDSWVCNSTQVSKNLFNGTWEQGTLSSSTGLPNTSTIRIRTTGYLPLNPSTQYTVECVGMNSIIVMQYDVNNGFLGTSGFQSIPYTFTSNANARYYKLVARIDDVAVVTPSNISNVQLEYGSTATSYVSYNPTSEYPKMPISTGDSGVIGMWSHKKNIVMDIVQGGINAPTGADLVSNARCRTDYIHLVAGEVITISVNGVYKLLNFIAYKESDKSYLFQRFAQDSTINGATTYTYTAPSSMYIRIVFQYQDGTTNFTPSDLITNGKPQVEYGSSKTSYEPYTGSNVDIPTPVGYIGGSLPNGVADTDTQKKIGKVVLNGSEDWQIGNAGLTNTYRAYFVLSSVGNTSISAINCMSDKFIGKTFANRDVDTEGIISCFYNSTTHRIDLSVLKSRGVSDIPTLKTWLASNNVTVHYELATPVDITITKPLIPTYQGNNTITSTNTVKPTLTVKTLKR